MSGSHLSARARRIVAGLDRDGRSTIVSDGLVETRLVSEAFTINQVWQATAVPTPVMADCTIRGEVVIAPPLGGYNVDITTFPPDSSWDYDAGYAKALAQGGVSDASGGDAPGMHRTDTIDIVTVVTGEIWALVETGEMLMRPGDTIIHRGTKHAWRNCSEADCTIVAVHVSVTRSNEDLGVDVAAPAILPAVSVD